MPGYCVQETKEGIRSMKQPFWKLNLGLLIIACSLLTLMLLYKIKLQKPYSIQISEPVALTLEHKQESFDAAKIYQEDLFRTYIAPRLEKSIASEPAKPMPQPPAPVIKTPPTIEPAKIVEPLPLTLTGVFMMNNDTQNRAIISNTKSQDEGIYKVGDEIEDAQIVKILPRSVLLIRSNGQREMIYISQDAATADSLKLVPKDWSRVVKHTDDNSYLVDKDEFATVIINISNLIDMFNLATAYKQGVSIGIKIGNFESSSLATNFEFTPGDIITKINNMPVTTTSERLAIYKEVTHLSNGANVTIEYLRNEQPATKVITLGAIVPPLISITKNEPPEKQRARIEKDQQLEALKQREKFAPTLRDIRQREQENIIRHQRAVENHKLRGRRNG